MKCRMFDDGSCQFLPEEGDPGFPIAPVEPTPSPAIEKLKVLAKAGDAQAVVLLANLEADHARAIEQHEANLAAYKKAKTDLAAFPKHEQGGKVLSKAAMEKAPWTVSAGEAKREK